MYGNRLLLSRPMLSLLCLLLLHLLALTCDEHGVAASGAAFVGAPNTARLGQDEPDEPDDPDDFASDSGGWFSSSSSDSDDDVFDWEITPGAEASTSPNQQESTNNTGSILDKVRTALLENSWKFDVYKDRNLISLRWKVENAGVLTVYFVAREDRDLLMVWACCPGHIPKRKRSVMAEFLIRANFGLSFGCLEMDFQDGEIRSRVSLNVEGGELSSDMIHNMILVAGNTLDKYYPGMMMLCYSNKDAETCLREIEKKDD